MKNDIRSYSIGFGISIFLTLAAYFTVVNQVLHGGILTVAILGLALLQLVAQLFFFLHLFHESNPRYKLVIFLSTISVVLLIVIASVWIMQHLNYNMMPTEMNKYIIKNEGMH